MSALRRMVRCMKVFLAGTERIESDVCRIGGGDNEVVFSRRNAGGSGARYHEHVSC